MDEPLLKMYCAAVPAGTNLLLWLGVKRMTRRGVVCHPGNRRGPLTAQEAFEALLFLRSRNPRFTYEIRSWSPRKSRHG